MRTFMASDRLHGLTGLSVTRASLLPELDVQSGDSVAERQSSLDDFLVQYQTWISKLLGCLILGDPIEVSDDHDLVSTPRY